MPAIQAMYMQSVKAATEIKQAQLGSAIGMAVMKKGLEARKAQGEAVVQLLEVAAQLSKAAHLGQNFDAVG